jgi:hypothetical protein
VTCAVGGALCVLFSAVTCAVFAVGVSLSLVPFRGGARDPFPAPTSAAFSGGAVALYSVASTVTVSSVVPSWSCVFRFHSLSVLCFCAVTCDL